MRIYSVTDDEFKPYGKVWDNVPAELLDPMVAELARTEIPAGSAYVPSAPQMESVAGADALMQLMFGGAPAQIGTCCGHNTKLNCLEYHRSSEFNLGARDFILLLAKRYQIEDGKLDTSLVKAFRAPAGALIEVYADTMHYTPVMVDEGGFQVMIGLPRDTNTAKPAAAGSVPACCDSYCYWKRDKWVLCHAESPKAAEGGYVGLVGENLDLADQIG